MNTAMAIICWTIVTTGSPFCTSPMSEVDAVKRLAEVTADPVQNPAAPMEKPTIYHLKQKQLPKNPADIAPSDPTKVTQWAVTCLTDTTTGELVCGSPGPESMVAKRLFLPLHPNSVNPTLYGIVK